MQLYAIYNYLRTKISQRKQRDLNSLTLKWLNKNTHNYGVIEKTLIIQSVLSIYIIKGRLSCVRTDTQRNVLPGLSRERNLRSKIWWFTEFCYSHFISHLAAFFIVARSKISIVKSCSFKFFVNRKKLKFTLSNNLVFFSLDVLMVTLKLVEV